MGHTVYIGKSERERERKGEKRNIVRDRDGESKREIGREREEGEYDQNLNFKGKNRVVKGELKRGEGGLSQIDS